MLELRVKKSTDIEENKIMQKLFIQYKIYEEKIVYKKSCEIIDARNARRNEKLKR